MTAEEREAVTIVFHQFETGLREGTIFTKVEIEAHILFCPVSTALNLNRTVGGVTLYSHPNLHLKAQTSITLVGLVTWSILQFGMEVETNGILSIECLNLNIVWGIIC